MGQNNILMGSNNSPFSFFFNVRGFLATNGDRIFSTIVVPLITWVHRIYSIFFFTFLFGTKVANTIRKFKTEQCYLIIKQCVNHLAMTFINHQIYVLGHADVVVSYCMISELDTHTINNIGILSQALVWCMTLA